MTNTNINQYIKRMRKIFTLLCLTLAFVTKAQTSSCIIDAGGVNVQEQDDTVKVWFGEPEFTCYPKPDSSWVRVKILCKNGDTDLIYMSQSDTLLLTTTSDVIVFSSRFWRFPSGKITRTDMENICFTGNYNGDCYEYSIIGESTNSVAVDTITPNVYLENGTVVSNVPGVLILLEYPSLNPTTIEFHDPFQQELPPGFWWVQVLLFDGTLIDLGIIVN